ncbi:HD domain-containing protein [Deinococcus maricopensis]|uniref:Metal dependent phosphohydrolase n=1 Tax=Deinococcus maricopensis (strain DSM 21211 / LMG 22137 / NRRL B-23946 / LB-34) TaxID=709986 RepID=E8U4I1_DEIML|nr:HD domain-containing protein [Deinococcus maricopensis]ADV68846.1 metal dependent phosphohydrolase [Deinococcus maricopensis DSM 21211]
MTTARTHELKDPIHGFVRLSSAERALLDTPPVQRLRHIHQLALSMMVYPGATHRRFEHSLGVMHLAGRAFDAITTNHARFPGALPPPDDADLPYWRTVVRMAALTHDLGHLPFSHAAEDLLPEGLDHEDLSDRVIRSDALAPAWRRLGVAARDVARVAVGARAGDAPLSAWERALSELITGSAFGADRVDYLLRDAHHSGAVGGGFDADRLVSRLLLLPSVAGESVVGVQAGALQAAEMLLSTRDFLYESLYFHPVRRILDHHLGMFLRAALGTPLLPEGDAGQFRADVNAHLALTDDEVFAALRRASRDPSLPGHRWARRVTCREHYRLLYRARQRPEERTAARVATLAREAFGASQVVFDPVERRPGPLNFLLLEGTQVVPASERSRLVRANTPISAEFVFIAPEVRDEARAWLRGALPDLERPT